MKRRVRIYKAQFGGVQALQEQQAQLQNQANDEAILAGMVAKLEQEDDVMPEDLLRQLMTAGIEQAKAAQLVRAAISIKEERDALKQAQAENDQEAVNDIEADQEALAADVEEENRQDEILAQMYESGDYDDGYGEEDQFVQDYIIDNQPQQPEMQRTGGMPSKRTFVRKASKVLKAQMGQEVAPPSKADSTDTGARQMMMASFLNSVQNTGNNALIKKDAEEAYNMTSMYPMSDPNTPEAQFGANMSRGQQRRFNRRLNRFIGNMPIPMQGMMPSGFVTYPMLQNMQQYMPVQGSYYGGPRLANIDVHRTGLFGRPKEYTITFANEALYDPTLRKQVIKQEARNRKVLTEDEVDELLKKEEEITGESTETTKAEEEKEASGKKDISSNSASSRSNTSSVRRNTQQTQPLPEAQPQPEVEAEPEPSTQSPAPWEEALQQNQAQNKPEWLETHPINPMDLAMANYARDKKAFNLGNYPAGPVEAKSSYSSDATPEDLFYYNPDKPGFSYVYKNNKLYYDDASDSKQDWHEIKDPSRISELNQKLRGADIFTLPGKEGFYYRQRPDGSYAKFQGDPAKHTSATKQVAVIKPGTSNFDYLNKNKQYAYSFSGKKMQMGGFTDEASGLNKFVYGGDESLFTIPETGGKLINSPFFEEGGSYMQEGGGGLTKYQYAGETRDHYNRSQGLIIEHSYAGMNDVWNGKQWVGSSDSKDGQNNDQNGKIVKAYKNGKFVGYMTQETADKHGLDWNTANDYDSDTDEDYNTNPQTVFPGGNTYFKQKGMPYFTGTGDPYTGYITPWTDLKSIQVKNRLFGAPKLTYNFGNYDPTAPLIGPKSTTTTPQNTQTALTEKPENQRSDLYYKTRQLFQNTMSGKEGDQSPKLRNWIDQKRSEKMGVPFPEIKAYGGDMDYAQTGENYPYAQDPRFAPVYTDNPDFVGMSDVDLVSGNIAGNVFGFNNQSIATDYDPGAVNTVDAAGNIIDFEAATPDITQTAAYKQAEKDPAMNLKIDPNQPNRQTQKKNLVGDFSIKGKAKTPKTNEQYIDELLAFNTLANKSLNKTGERGDAQREAQLRNRYLGDSLYGSTGQYDRGTYEINSGLFRPDQMGFTGVVKEGGTIYKEGGTHYMSADQVKKFLEEGGELEFV